MQGTIIWHHPRCEDWKPLPFFSLLSYSFQCIEGFISVQSSTSRPNTSGPFAESSYLLESFFVLRIISRIDLSSTRFFYKKLGSGHSTKSFLISYEILSILVLKVS